MIKWNEYTWYSKISAIFVFLAIFPIWTFYIGMKYQETKTALSEDRTVRSASFIHTEKKANGDFKNATYTINGVPITLENGKSEMPITPNSASNIVTQYFGNEVMGDLNEDGLDDVAFILTQQTGGSSTFYYVAVAFNNQKYFVGINTVLLGDRIILQNTEIRDGQIIVNYSDRAFGQPMTVNPSIGVSKYLTVLEGKLVEKR